MLPCAGACLKLPEVRERYATTFRATPCYAAQYDERSECRATGNFDDGAVDVARFVRCEPCIRVGDFLGLPESAQRYAIFHHLDDLCRHRREDRRVDEAGTDCVGTNALLAQFAGPRLHHADDTELGRSIIGLAEIAVDPDDGRRIENAARILLEHDVDHGPGAVVDALEVDVDHPIELLVGHFLELRVLDDACVVDQGVYPAPFGHHASDHYGDRLLIGDIDAEADGIASGVGNQRRCFLGRRDVNVANCDFGAFFGELERRRASNALSAARDDRNLTFKPHDRSAVSPRPTQGLMPCCTAAKSTRLRCDAQYENAVTRTDLSCQGAAAMVLEIKRLTY